MDMSEKQLTANLGQAPILQKTDSSDYALDKSPSIR